MSDNQLLSRSFNEDFYESEKKSSSIKHTTHHTKIFSQEILYKYTSPLEPLLPRNTFNDTEATKYGNSNIRLMALPHFIQAENNSEPITTENITLNNGNNVSSKYLGRLH